MFYHLPVRAWFLITVFCGLQPFATAAQVPQVRLKAGVIPIRTVEDVISNWTPDSHVFVKGDVGVGQRQLEQLNTWIEKNAPHWTVVLMRDAADEAFRAADGREYRGLDAVEYALGYGLSNRTGFGALEHPQTGESDGAVFVLFLKERKFSYFGSQAQDRRGLGESNWVGKLDQPAFRAMRSGGRIFDAAKDTIQSINERLQQAIRSEADAEERAMREREQAEAALRRELQQSRQDVEQVQLASANFRLNNPQATGSLAKPPLDNWNSELNAIEAELRPDSARILSGRVASVTDAIEKQLNGFALLDGLPEFEQQLNANLAELSAAPNQVAQQQVGEINDRLATAKQLAQDGQLGFYQDLAKIESLLADGRAAIAAEQQRLKLASLRLTWIRRTMLFTLALAGLLAGAMLFFFNRRRKPAMLEAQQELTEREAMVMKETDGVNELFVRSDELLGSRERLKKRGYEGTTKATTEKTLDYIDDLFIMSKEVRRVLGEARELVYPSGPIGRIANLFSSSRYQQAVNRVNGKPLRFSRTSGLPLVLRDRFQENNGEAVPDEISMTFEEVFQAFKQRGHNAAQKLDLIENCLANVNDDLVDLQHRLEDLTSLEKQLANASVRDGYFTVPSFFERLIPSVQEDLAMADRLSTFDAIEAKQHHIPQAERKLNEAKQLADRLMVARQEMFPALHDNADKLTKLEITSTWIDQDLQALSQRANDLFASAAEQSIAPETEQLDQQFDALRNKSQTALDLATQVIEQTIPQLDELSARAEKTRATLADHLQLDQNCVLNEVERDPDDWIENARKHLTTARSTLEFGRIDAAQAALDSLSSSASEAERILIASLAAIENFEKQQKASNNELERLAHRSTEVEDYVDRLSQRYVGGTLAMRFDSSLAGRLNEEGDADKQPSKAYDVTEKASDKNSLLVSVEDLVRDAEWPRKDANNQLHQAESARRLGNVLEASDIQAGVLATLADAHFKLDSVQQFLESVESQAVENQSELQRLQSQAAALEASSRDPLIRNQTLQAISRLIASLEPSQLGLVSGQLAPNPFHIADNLQDKRLLLEQLNSQCTADRQAHAEASRAVAGARRQLQTAQQLVRQSQTDRIPDSQATTQLTSQILQLGGQIDQLERGLKTAHGEWQAVDEQAFQLQIDLSAATEKLGDELQHAGKALSIFQSASQAVYRAEQWSGEYGMHISGSPGVIELERARSGLQQGNYSQVLQLAGIAVQAAQAAIAQAEREVARRRFAAQQAAEAERRRREARSRPTFGGGNFSVGSGRSFGGSSSRSGSSSSSSRSSGSGFGRSGW